MSLENWNEISPLVKRNPQKFFNYLAEELGLETSWDDLTVIERRSRHKQYRIIQETVTDLPAWNELSPFERRNLKKLYKKIKSVVEGSDIQEQTITPEPVAPATYDVSVSVKDSEDQGVQGAVVTLTDSTDNTITFTKNTGSAGGCTVKPTAGTYIVTVTCKGYEEYTASENLVVNENTSLSIILTSSETPQEGAQ